MGFLEGFDELGSELGNIEEGNPLVGICELGIVLDGSEDDGNPVEGI